MRLLSDASLRPPKTERLSGNTSILFLVGDQTLRPTKSSARSVTAPNRSLGLTRRLQLERPEAPVGPLGLRRGRAKVRFKGSDFEIKNSPGIRQKPRRRPRVAL